jgi:GMP synthase-like glutamine amidotransferase
MTETEKTIQQLKDEVKRLQTENMKLVGVGVGAAHTARALSVVAEVHDADELADGNQLRFMGKNYAKFIEGQTIQQ